MQQLISAALAYQSGYAHHRTVTGLAHQKHLHYLLLLKVPVVDTPSIDASRTVMTNVVNTITLFIAWKLLIKDEFLLIFNGNQDRSSTHYD